MAASCPGIKFVSARRAAFSHTSTLDNSSDIYFEDSFDYVSIVVFNAAALLVSALWRGLQNKM